MKILGFDPSLRNWGIAITSYDPIADTLTVHKVDVIKTKTIKDKKQSKAVLDLQRAQTLIEGLLPYLDDVELIVIELPLGSQTASAMKSYGMCLGITACLTTLGIPFIYKTPFDLKRVIGKRETTKEEIIDWVNQRHPNVLSKYKTSAEHQADAVLAIYSALPDIRELYEKTSN